MERSHISALSAQKGGARNGRSISIFLDSANMLFLNSITHSPKALTLTILKILICFTIYFNSITQAHAAVGGWSLGNPFAEGASAVYTGTKNALINGKNVVQKGVATITPTPAQVAKNILKVGGGLALSVAVEQLLGAVDWVLDPANNQIKYTIPKEASCTASSCNYRIDGIGTFATTSLACSAFFAQSKATGRYVVDNDSPNSPGYCLGKLNSDGFTDVVIRVNQIVDTSQEDKEKTIPLPTVAQKIISNANAGDATAQATTMAAAADVVKEAETDDTKARPIVSQLEKSAETATDETATGETTKTDPKTGETTKTDLNLKFPVFCSWAPSVCQAAQVVINFPTLVTEWWETATTAISEAYTATKEYFKESPKEQEKTTVDIDNIPVPTPSVNISIGDNICPSLPFEIYGKQLNLSPVYLCQQAEMIRTFFIALGFWTASMIVGRRK